MSDRPRVRVAALIIRDDSLLLVRHEKDGQTYWLLPGGGVDYGESLAAALVREVAEETGFRVRVGRLLFVSDSIPPDLHRHMIQATFEAEIEGGAIRLGDDPRLAECVFVQFADLPNIVLYPNMKHALMSWVDDGVGVPASYLGNLWES